MVLYTSFHKHAVPRAPPRPAQGRSRDDDALTLEVLSLAVGDEVIDVLDP